MEREKVVSSNIASVGYDPDRKLLEIEFKSGAVYQYRNIRKEKWQGLMAAESHGGYFVKEIKPYPALYPYRKISG